MAGIYLHIPFCKSKCSYCDFYSVANNNHLESFLDALSKEIAYKQHLFKGKTIKTIYFGGGTPSILSRENIEGIFNLLDRHFYINSVCEITFEANPDDLSKEYLSNLAQTPINRLSIGIQNTNNEILKLMHRRHDFETAKKSILDSRDLGFENISIDMIYGVDGVKDIEWEQQLESVLCLPVEHLSAYHLGIEPNTLLYKKVRDKKFKEIDESSSLNQYKTLVEISNKFGFEQYEISNFAKAGKESKHNSSYWDRTEYLGLGPSAHSLLGKTRMYNFSNLKKYISLCNSKEKMFDSEELNDTDIYNETIMLKLRTREGLNLTDFRFSFGKTGESKLLNKLKNINSCHFKIDNDHITLSDSGMIVSNDIISDLFEV